MKEENKNQKQNKTGTRSGVKNCYYYHYYVYMYVCIFSIFVMIIIDLGAIFNKKKNEQIDVKLNAGIILWLNVYPNRAFNLIFRKIGSFY